MGFFAMRDRLFMPIGIGLVLLLVISLPAKADSINTFNFSTSLVGASGSVSGSFSYDTANHTFTSASLTFDSPIFGDLNFMSSNPQNGYLFIFMGKSGGSTVLYSILINPFNLSQFWLNGAIWNLNGAYAGYNYTQVPEGEDWFLYLIPSATVICGAFLMAGKRRPELRAVTTA